MAAAQIETEEHPKVRAALVYALGATASKNHIGVLGKLTSDALPEVRYRAVEALLRFQDPSVYPILVRSMGRDGESKIRDLAAHHLMQLGRERLLELFESMMDSDKPWKREAVVLACQLFNSPAVVPFLVRAYQAEEGALKEIALAGLRKLKALGNSAAERAVTVIEARLKPRPEAPSPEISADLTEDESRLGFDDTYTGEILPRMEYQKTPFDSASTPRIRNPLQAPPEPEDEAPPRATVRSKLPSALPPAPLPFEARDQQDPTPIRGTPPGASALPRPTTPMGDSGSSPRRQVPPDILEKMGMGGMVTGPKGAESGKGAAGTRPCPVCGEEIAVSAKKCRFCNEVFDKEGLKEARGGTGAITGQMPTALSVITLLSIVFNGFLVLFGLMMMGGEKPEDIGTGVVLVVLAAISIWGAILARKGRAAGRNILMVLCVLNLLSLRGLLGSLIWIYILSRDDVKAYCSE